MIRALLALVLLLPLAPNSSEAFVFKKIVYCSPIEGFIHWKGIWGGRGAQVVQA